MPYGSSYILQIAVSDSQGRQCALVVAACPTGTVTLLDTGKPLKDFSGSNTVALNSQAIAEDQPVQFAPGIHSLVANYSGDNSYNGSSSMGESVTITPAPVVPVVTAGPTPINTNTSVTISAKITTQSSGVGPTGSVVFKANGTQIGNAVAVVPTAASGLNSASPVSAFAIATTTHTFATPGSISLTATYTTGDGNYASNSGTANITVSTTGTVPTSTALTASATTITTGNSVMLTATVTASNKNGPGVSGSIQFMNGTQALGSPATCTPTQGTLTTGGTCVATLSTALSNVPPGFITPTRAPRVPPSAPLALATCILALLLFAAARRSGAPARRGLGYAFACALVMIGIATGFAGCGGGGSGGTPTPTTHVDSITAVYSGDNTYIGSTSAAVAVTVSTQ